MNPCMIVCPGIIAFRIHALVDDHGQAFFACVKPTDNPEHLIHDRFKLFAVMYVTGIDTIVKGQF